jgi:hypothetical protein
VHNRLVGLLRHYRTAPVSYVEYAAETRRVLERVAPGRFQVFVATDERPFVEFMRAQFADRIVALDVPRAGANGGGVHLDPAIPAAEKGESAVLDALLLASTNYVIKGRSNLSDAALVFNPRLAYSFCPDVSIPTAGRCTRRA